MTIAHAWTRWLAWWSLAAALVLAALLAGHARAEPAEGPSLEEIKTTLDQVEEAVGRDDVTQEALVELRQKLNAATDTLRDKIDDLEPRVREAEERLKQLGPAPAKDAPPEIKEIADQREELTTSAGELDGALKQARVLSVRIDQLSERISQKRHALYANELFARTGALDPLFWSDVLRAVPIEIKSFRAHGGVVERARQQPAHGPRRIDRAGHHHCHDRARSLVVPRLHPGAYGTRSAKAWMALWVFLWLAARTPAASLAILLVWNVFGLLTFRVEQIAWGLVAAIGAAAFGRGVARGMFAPGGPSAAWWERTTRPRSAFNHLVWAARLWEF